MQRQEAGAHARYAGPYVVANDGVTLPVVDVTDPSFVLTLDEGELQLLQRHRRGRSCHG
jgi:hypothetical protein